MQLLTDARRAEAKAKGTVAKRAKASPEVKAASDAFYKSMLVESAYEGELFADFSQWLTKNEVSAAKKM